PPMIDERHEELAALYALDLLEGPERAQFELALRRHPGLQVLVDELRATSGALAHTAPPAAPPPELRQRVLVSAAHRGGPARASNVVPFRMLPWAIAACFALTSLWLGRLYFAARSEAGLQRDRQELTDAARQAAQNQLDAERLVTARRLADTT